MDEKSVPRTSGQASNDGSSNQNSSSEKFLGFNDFSIFDEQFSSTIKATVSAATKITLKQNELDYYLTCPAFKNFLQAQNDRCLKIISTILKQQGIKKANINSSRLDDEERMDMIIDSNDQLIEKLGIQLDEIQGLRKKTETELKLTVTDLKVTSRNINTSWNKDMGMISNKAALQYGDNSGSNNISQGTESKPEAKKGLIIKPQKFFKDRVDNSYLPFIPKLRNKPNQQVPLPEIFSMLDEKNIELSKELFEKHPELLENPYIFEIDRVQVSDCYSDQELKIQLPINFEETPFKYIDDVKDLIWLVEHLGKDNRSRIKEIAVDLEHHNYRSFLGFTCLMQISTRFDDFIIDTIKLRSEMHRLNEIFTDWTLIKVFHGSDFDIEWLQKDFGIYVVNMFDTGQASRVLQYPHFSLSYLLQKFCSINAQKQYQLADWRQRPLSEAMIRYAREDTHYLLYIYDNIREDLIKFQQKEQMKLDDSQIDLTSQISLVMEKSKAICRKNYKKPLFYTKGFLNLCQHNSHLNSKQMKALRDLYEWRDKIAREADESCEYVLKNHQLLKIAELLPREIYGILALCNPLSPIVESNVHEILEVVKKAREFSGNLTSIGDLVDTQNRENNSNDKKQSQPKSVLESIAHLATYDPNSIINCAHDFPTDHKAHMETEHQENSMLNLNEILLKPTQLSENIELPSDLYRQAVSTLTSLFAKDLANSKINEKSKLNNKIKDLEEKVKKIKEETENPFQIFLPIEFRQNEKKHDDLAKWKLMKPLKKAPLVVGINKPEPIKLDEEAKASDITMIPLKQQYKYEKYSGEKKAKKRSLKNIDFTDAIIEYNNSKVGKVTALGGDVGEGMINNYQNDDIDNEINSQQKKLDQLLQKKIQSNLNILSKQSIADAEVDSAEGCSIYTYNPHSMNKLFAKPELNKEEFDPTSKIRNSKHSKVNKRRTTNAVTRMKNNHSMSYKSNKSSGGSGKS